MSHTIGTMNTSIGRDFDLVLQDVEPGRYHSMRHIGEPEIVIAGLARRKTSDALSMVSSPRSASTPLACSIAIQLVRAMCKCSDRCDGDAANVAAGTALRSGCAAAVDEFEQISHSLATTALGAAFSVGLVELQASEQLDDVSLGRTERCTASNARNPVRRGSYFDD